MDQLMRMVRRAGETRLLCVENYLMTRQMGAHASVAGDA